MRVGVGHLEVVASGAASMFVDNKVVRLEAEHTKAKVRRLVPLNRDACAALRRLRRVCDDHFPDSPYVFTHTSPRYLGERVGSVAKVFQSAVTREGIAHATPHALRHTGITEGVHAPGANVVDIAHIAGHKDLRTTMRYIHTSTPRLHDAVAKLPNVSTS